MQIVFDESTLRQSSSASRSVTGVLYFDLGTRCFPEENWNDFPVVVISWWLDGIKSLENRTATEVRLRFMDGPYFVAVTRAAGDLVELRFVEDRSVQNVQHEERVTCAHLIDRLHVTAKEVAAACIRTGFSSRDLDVLKAKLPN